METREGLNSLICSAKIEAVCRDCSQCFIPEATTRFGASVKCDGLKIKNVDEQLLVKFRHRALVLGFVKFNNYYREQKGFLKAQQRQVIQPSLDHSNGSMIRTCKKLDVSPSSYTHNLKLLMVLPHYV